MFCVSYCVRSLDCWLIFDAQIFTSKQIFQFYVDCLVDTWMTYRCLGIWCRICTVAGRAQQADQWIESCSQFSCWWHWTPHYCWQRYSTFWWHFQAQRHCCESWCLPYLVWNVEDTSRKMFYVDWWVPIIWAPQGVCVPAPLRCLFSCGCFFFFFQIIKVICFFGFGGEAQHHQVRSFHQSEKNVHFNLIEYFANMNT